MTTPLILIGLIAVSFALARWMKRYTERFVVLSGAEYMLLGVLLGPQVPPRLLTLEAVHVIQPLLALLVGLLGFLVGLRTVKTGMSGPSSAVGALSGLGVLALVGGAFIWAAELLQIPGGGSTTVIELYRAFEHRLVLRFSDENLWFGLAVGSAACVASVSLVEETRAQLGGGGPQGRVLSILAETSQWVGITGLGLALALARSSSHGPIWTAALGLALVGGALCGLLFSLFIGRETDSQRVFLAAVGAVTFAAGAGHAVGFSPLFVNLVAGWTVARTSSHAPAVLREMERLSHPLFVMTMLIAGAMWIPVSGMLWVLPAVYLAVRVAARFLMVTIFTQALLDARPGLHNGLWAQGTVAVAIAVSVAQRFPERASIVLTTVLVGTLGSELFSHRLLRSVLVDAGESELVVESPEKIDDVGTASGHDEVAVNAAQQGKQEGK